MVKLHMEKIIKIGKFYIVKRNYIFTSLYAVILRLTIFWSNATAAALQGYNDSFFGTRGIITFHGLGVKETMGSTTRSAGADRAKIAF